MKRDLAKAAIVAFVLLAAAFLYVGTGGPLSGSCLPPLAHPGAGR